MIHRIALASGAACACAVVIALAHGAPAHAGNGESCNSPLVQLVNGGLEEPVKNLNNASYLPQAEVPGWSTTDSAIEIWGSGYLGVSAFQGRQFAELNYLLPGTLYQDVETTPGSKIYWSLAHRARNLTSNPVKPDDQVIDVMRVLIGASPTGADPTAGLTQSGSNLSDDAAQWGVHTGTYVVPANQTTTRFAFQAVSSGSNEAAAGNFLDAITFTTAACVEAVLEVDLADAVAGSELTYTLTLSHVGGSPTSSIIVSIPVPTGTTYVDASASAGGVLSGGNIVFTQPGGTGGAGVLGAGEELKFSFKVTVDDPAQLSSIDNTATLEIWPTTPSEFDSNMVTTRLPGGSDPEIRNLLWDFELPELSELPDTGDEIDAALHVAGILLVGGTSFMSLARRRSLVGRTKR